MSWRSTACRSTGWKRWSTATSPSTGGAPSRFLAIVGEHWPKILAERGQIDALDRRTRAIRAQAERWRERPPATPVIAAGSTGSQPATRELLAVIAGLPQGAVVLPGLDREMDDGELEQLDPTHPQFGLRELLLALGRERGEVADWPGAAATARAGMLIAELMRPARDHRRLAAAQSGRARPCHPRRLRHARTRRRW